MLWIFHLQWTKWAFKFCQIVWEINFNQHQFASPPASYVYWSERFLFPYICTNRNARQHIVWDPSVKFLSAVAWNHWYEVFQETPLHLPLELCVSAYAVLIGDHPSHPHVNGLDHSIPNYSPASLPAEQNVWFPALELHKRRKVNQWSWAPKVEKRRSSRGKGARQRGRWGALSAERRSRKKWLEESFGGEEQEEKSNQKAGRAWRGERLFRTRLKTLCCLSSPYLAPSGSIYAGADEGGEGGGGSCQQFI